MCSEHRSPSLPASLPGNSTRPPSMKPVCDELWHPKLCRPRQAQVLPACSQLYGHKVTADQVDPHFWRRRQRRQVSIVQAVPAQARIRAGG
jgi:hypothetical protein